MNNKNTLYCISTPPILLLVNFGTAVFLTLAVTFYLIYLSFSYLSSSKKKDFFQNKIKILIWLIPILIYLVSVYFIGENLYLYVLTPAIFSLSTLITIYFGVKSRIIRKNKKLKIIASIILFLSLSLFSIKTIDELGLIKHETEEGFITIENPVGNCSPSIF